MFTVYGGGWLVDILVRCLPTRPPSLFAQVSETFGP